MESPKLYRVGELAKKLGKTARALRFYEQLGLLLPHERTSAGYRLYGEDALLQVQWIEQLQGMGFSLGDIKKFLEGLDQAHSRPSKMNQIRSFYEERLRETQAQIQKLIALEQQLEYSLSTLDPCSRCDTSAEEHHCHGCLQETLANQQNTDLPAVLIPVVQRVLQDTQDSGIQ